MVLWATILFLQGAGFVGSVTGIPGVPENITVMFLNPTSVRVSWSTSQVEQVEKYDVTYKPTDARVVAVVAGNSEAVTLSNLRADTQYQLVVTAVRAGKKFRSRPIVFRTLEPPRTSPQQDAAVTGGPLPPPPPSSQQPQPYIQIRGVEVGIVVLVLIVWAGAIALFFNRWGKIRMLLPYQPDYKEQLKVPGTGVCTATNSAYTQHPTQHACSQHLHWSNHHVDSLDSGGALGWPRTSRPRVNSAIDVAGFLSQEFLRRHGSTSKLCRKVRSADNLPLVSTNRQQDQQRNSKDDGIEGDREYFLKPNQDDKSDDQESRRQSSIESATKDNMEMLLDSGCQQPSSRDSPVASSSLIAKRFGGWRTSGNHEYVRCPVRQPASMDERCYRRSCEFEATRPLRYHHYHRRTDTERHSKSCDYARRGTTDSSIEVQHFGLPILSVSEPSPPDESERVDDYL
ncbi:FNDC5 protein [Camponotus japonicus]